MKKTTITTLAEELGVTPSTISRALNDSPKISEARRKEVRELARKRGFQLRDFATRITNLCVLICTTTPEEDLFSTYTDQVINGVNQYCNKNSLELSIFSSPTDRLNRMNTVKELLRRGVNGVVILNARDNSTFIQTLEKAQIPYCCLISGNPKFPDRILSINNRALAAQGTEYLIQLGHRHIAFLYDDRHSQAYSDRLAGYQDAMTAAGLPLHPYEMPTPTNEANGMEFGFRTVEQLLAQYPETTAIFAVSNDLIEGAHSAIHRKGLTVPDDLSLLGCDDSPHAEYWRPPLTVIDIPNERLGYTAASWVHQQITGTAASQPPKGPWMQGHLIIRKTTAAPRPRR
jgi:DNA-binding LacI/PurR family transcriptional regulator